MSREPRDGRGWRRAGGTCVISQTHFPQQGSDVDFFLPLPYDTLGHPPLPGRDQLPIQVDRVGGCTEPQKPEVGVRGANARLRIFSAHIVDQRS